MLNAQEISEEAQKREPQWAWQHLDAQPDCNPEALTWNVVKIFNNHTREEAYKMCEERWKSIFPYNDKTLRAIRKVLSNLMFICDRRATEAA